MGIFSSPFSAVFLNEVRLRSKTVAPYFMVLLCAGNGLLWWGWGPAVGRGIAINSDYFIAGALPPYSFMTLPLFTALFMADTISKDFRLGIDPLIFSKPISRVEYLLGKFFGNFFILACCQSAFVVAWFLLQWVHKAGVTTLPGIRVVPYIKHFLILVVVSHMGLAAFYFVVGALTRSTKIVYGLGACFYPVYFLYQLLFLNNLPPRVAYLLDPLLMSRQKLQPVRPDPAVVNYLSFNYCAGIIANRIGMLLIVVALLTFLYYRFKTEEDSTEKTFSWLNLSSNSGLVFYDMPTSGLGETVERSRSLVPIPTVVRATNSLKNNLKKLIAALEIEFRLLLSERSLLVVMSLAVFISIFEVTFWAMGAQPTFSAAYAENTARSMLLFLVGIPIFYIGEAIHRDRDVRVDGVLWSHPIPNYVLLSAKFISTMMLVLGFVVTVGVLAVLLQIIKLNFPLELAAYLKIYLVILVPNAIFLCAFCLALHVLLVNRYLAYAVFIGVCVSASYLYSQGYSDGIYNPLLFRLWNYPDLSGPKLSGILFQRLYILGLALVLFTLAHIVSAWRTLRMPSRVFG